MIKITTDSTCDLSTDLVEKYNLDVLPLIVTLGEEDFYDEPDSLTTAQIFDFVAKNNILPKTAARSIEDYIDFFKNALKKADEIIHIGLSSELSSSYTNACLAAQEIGGDKVHIIDSKTLSSGIALLLIQAKKLADAGKSSKEIIDEVEKMVEKDQTSFVVDKLDYLYKGGRCSKFSFSIGSFLKIRPRLQLVDGKIVNTGKDMGPQKMVLKKYIDFLVSKYPNPKKGSPVFFTHSFLPTEMVTELKEYVKSKGIFEEIIEQTAGSVISSHCGQGCFGLLYLYE